MISLPKAELPVLPCYACQLRPAQIPDLFCSACRSLIQARTDGPLKLARIWRVVRTLLVESLFGIFTGLLVLCSISAASTSTMKGVDIVGLVGGFALFIAPIIARIHTWMVRPSLQRATEWGWISTLRVLVLMCLMLFAVVVCGLRYTTFPKPAFVLGLIGSEWLLGIAIARWQEHYLPPPAQRRAEWRAWSWRGWTLACAIQFVVNLLIPYNDLGLWLGIAASVVTYELIAQLMIMRFAHEAALVKELQRDYRFVWYNV